MPDVAGARTVLPVMAAAGRLAREIHAWPAGRRISKLAGARMIAASGGDRSTGGDGRGPLARSLVVVAGTCTTCARLQGTVTSSVTDVRVRAWPAGCV